MRGARIGLAILGTGMLLAVQPAGAQTVPGQERPGDALSRHLRSLAQNPRSLHALMGAGRAALELGDAQAALTFFARAEGIDARDGRIKMWIGSALVQLQQPRSALKFFGDAQSLGVPEADLAGERGVAWDILGDQRRAQADYRLALRKAPNAETMRRLALSLAISGEREPALRQLEDQLLVRDRAGERTRALVLALTGDASGATRALQSTLGGPQAETMASFLAHLPALSPTDRALAVHLGHFNGRSSGRPQTYAANTAPSFSAAVDAGRPDPTRPALGSRNPVPAPASTAPRRRPGTEGAAAKTPAQPARTSASTSRESAWDWSRGVSRNRPKATPPQRTAAAPATPAPTTPAAAARTRPVPAQPGPRSDPPAAEAERERTVRLAELAPSTVSRPQELAAGPAETAPGFSLAPGASAPAPAAERQPAGNRLADIEAALAALPDEVRAEPAPPKVAPPKPAVEKPTPARAVKTAKADPPKARKAATPPKEPARHWVQVAGGANKTALPAEFARLKGKAPKLLASRVAWTTPLKATNRLLVGPFGSEKEAQAFVNELAKADLGAFSWTSEEGQKIERLAVR